MLEIIVYIVAAILAFAGLIMIVINLPGIWLVYISSLIMGIMDKFQNITPTILLILFLLCILSTFTDNIAAALGAKQLGGTGWGMAGAIIGGIVGMFVGGIYGIFLGPLVGAVIFEMIFANKDLISGLKAGWGTFLGVLFSMIFKFALGVGIIVFTLVKIF